VWLCTLSDCGRHVIGPVKVDLTDLRDLERLQLMAGSQNGRVNWIGGLSALGKHLSKSVESADDDEPPGPPSDAAAEPFPTSVLPAPIATFVTEGSASLPCPPDFIGVLLLPALGCASGTSRVIELRPGWTEGPRINAAVVADPGSKKSPALDLVMQPMYAQQERYRALYEQAELAHQLIESKYEVDLEVWRKAAKTGKTEGLQRPTAPEPPHMAQIWTADTTIEALAELLEANPRGIILVRDELAGWVRGMNQYRHGHGADRQHWLSFWSGAPVIINRKARRCPIMLSRPMVCVVGMPAARCPRRVGRRAGPRRWICSSDLVLHARPCTHHVADG
jgi:hypothetical protein